MHETIEAIQVALTVWTTVGAGGYLLGKRGHGTRSSPAADPLPLSDGGRRLTETISDNPAERRFEIRVDGELAGFTEYERGDGSVVFDHTEVDPKFRGRGMAGKLIAFALDSTRSAGLEVQPLCPFVRKFMEKHGEYRDLIAPVTASAEAGARSQEE